LVLPTPGQSHLDKFALDRQREGTGNGGVHVGGLGEDDRDRLVSNAPMVALEAFRSDSPRDTNYWAFGSPPGRRFAE
jgi:hypothetical protein